MTVLVLDLDGVVVRGHPEGGRWDKNLERDLRIDAAAVQEKFFRPHFQKIAIGEADLYETLERVWPELGCDASPRAFVDYWFRMDSLLNFEVIGLVSIWRANGKKAYLATTQEHYRATHIWTLLNTMFDGMFYSAEVGAAKPGALFYRRVMDRLPGIEPADILFLDDTQANVDGAAALGWNAHLFGGATALTNLIGQQLYR